MGDSIDLFCQIQKGDRPIKVHWSFERNAGEPGFDHLQPQMRTNRISGKTSMLSIPSATQAHTGRYTCIASNKAGTTTYSADLTVNGTKIDSILKYILVFAVTVTKGLDSLCCY